MLDHFGEELKLIRIAAEMSQQELAEAISYSTALVGKIENGDRRPSADFARRCDSVFNTSGLFVRIQRLISRDGMVAWFREWAGIEAEAIALRSFEPLFVPGLLQTEAYARALLAASALLAPGEIEQQVVARLERQEILTRENPPLLTVVIDEFVLRRPVGGPTVMKEQLQHLVKLGTSMPRVRIHVVPLSVGAYAGLNGPFVIATPPVGEDVVYIEGQLHGQTFDRAEDMRHAVQVWESIRGEALPHQQSLELISEVAETWT
ncbi:helix-turn-helix domain-containing protein [Micromonospora sp. NBC_01796]|uniref:helix-turn-helix domain-containing protein n=1 Tax=Micromonospora sp. NBC_01796 TaxID=2975987 RepID=UPI002DD938A9|nr:helix-turn-helix transcriptional regulator [Micromonospora sp. NBC_01796]WSA87164.1 helix-turn-helix transcriptional regulator [Micromonospora sp. NBC_01796]